MKIEFGSYRAFIYWQWQQNYGAGRQHIDLFIDDNDMLRGLIHMPQSRDPTAYAYGAWSRTDIRQAWNFQRRQRD